MSWHREENSMKTSDWVAIGIALGGVLSSLCTSIIVLRGRNQVLEMSAAILKQVADTYVPEKVCVERRESQHARLVQLETRRAH